MTSAIALDPDPRVFVHACELQQALHVGGHMFEHQRRGAVEGPSVLLDDVQSARVDEGEVGEIKSGDPRGLKGLPENGDRGKVKLTDQAKACPVSQRKNL